MKPNEERPITYGYVGGTKVKCLWDTGSQISLIDHRKLAQILKINENKAYAKRLPEPRDVELVAANGKPLIVLAMYDLKIKFGKKLISGPFFVIKNLPSEMIIGCDLMELNDVSINLKRKRIKICSVQRKQNDLELDNENEMQLSINRKLVLRPKSETNISVQLPSYFGQETEILYENYPFDSDIIIPEAVSPIQVNREGKLCVNLVFVNLSANHKTLEKNQIIGQVSRGSKIKTFKIDSLQKQVKVEKSQELFSLKDLNLEAVPERYKEKYLEIVNKYSSVFSKGKLDVGNCPIMPHVIKLKDETKVVNIPPYRMPYHLQGVASEYVENLLKANIIRRSTSPFSSPLMLVRKANADPQGPVTHQYRVVHNYKKVNENIERCAYPLRNLYELIDNVAKGKIYTVIDLSQGYFNQRVVDEFGCTAFSLPSVGHFEYVRSPMGINSSPAFFQRLLDFITSGLKDVYVYMDDVIISSDCYETNLKTLEQTLARFKKYNMKCNLKKTKFGSGRVEYLGYDISHKHGIRPGKLKTEAIKNFREPSNVKEIKQFLGLCSFFRRVVPKFSFLSQPLSNLTRKTSGYSKGPLPENARQAFQALQNALIQRPCLAPVDFSKEFIVTVDTSQTATGAILSQNKNGTEHPCAYFSSVLKECDSRKSAYHREQLGILQALKHFKPYLFGKHFTLRTDHKPLTTAQTGKLDVLDRIGENIKEFEPFTWQYMKGEIIPADYLSRPPPKKVDAIVQKPFLQNQPGIADKDIYLAQQQDVRVKALAIRLKYKSKPQAEILRSFVNTWAPACKIKNGLVVDKEDRIFLPTSLKNQVLQTFHDNWGHKNKITTLELISKNWVWPEMKLEIFNYVESCDVCGKVKPPHKYSKLPLQAGQNGTYFNEKIHLDCLTNLTPSLSNFSAVLVIVDSFSGYVMAKPITKPNSLEVQTLLINEWISQFSTPKIIVTDGGREFVNQAIQNTANLFNFHHIVTSPGHSRSNGLAERKIRQLVEFLRFYTEQPDQNWPDYLPSFNLITNLTKSSRGFSPYFLVYKQEPRLPLEKLIQFTSYSEEKWVDKLRNFAKITDLVLDRQEEVFLQNKKQHDKTAQTLKLTPGDKIYVDQQKGHNRKLDDKFSGPFLCLEDLGDHVIYKEAESSKPKKVHKDRIKLGTFREQITDILTSLTDLNVKPDKIRVRNKEKTIWDDDDDLNREPHVGEENQEDLQPPDNPPPPGGDHQPPDEPVPAFQPAQEPPPDQGEPRQVQQEIQFPAAQGHRQVEAGHPRPAANLRELGPGIREREENAERGLLPPPPQPPQGDPRRGVRGPPPIPGHHGQEEREAPGNKSPRTRAGGHAGQPKPLGARPKQSGHSNAGNVLRVAEVPDREPGAQASQRSGGHKPSSAAQHAPELRRQTGAGTKASTRRDTQAAKSLQEATGAPSSRGPPQAQLPRQQATRRPLSGPPQAGHSGTTQAQPAKTTKAKPGIGETMREMMSDLSPFKKNQKNPQSTDKPGELPVLTRAQKKKLNVDTEEQALVPPRPLEYKEYKRKDATTKGKK